MKTTIQSSDKSDVKLNLDHKFITFTIETKQSIELIYLRKNDDNTVEFKGLLKENDDIWYKIIESFASFTSHDIDNFIPHYNERYFGFSVPTTIMCKVFRLGDNGKQFAFKSIQEIADEKLNVDCGIYTIDITLHYTIVNKVVKIQNYFPSGIVLDYSTFEIDQ